MRIFPVALAIGALLFPVFGRYLLPVNTAEQWCRDFEQRTEFKREQAQKYLDNCEHLDVKTGTEIKSQR